MTNQAPSHLVWLDLEMTGLDPEICTIIEIATIVTDSDLNVLATGPNLAIHQTEEMLDVMDDWNVKHHTASGLIERVRASQIDLAEAERQTLEFVQQYVAPRAAPLCGNSIWQDRRFLSKYMPEFESYLHYRNIDVSSIKELVRRWYPNSFQAPLKRASHVALDDIQESIRELEFYRNRIFIDPPPQH